jgi:hypothetical protein
LQGEYATIAIEMKCDQLGWYHERNGNTVTVYHPAGGTVTVDQEGQLDAQGFHGSSCTDATLPLEQALGRRLGESVKPEMNEVIITQKVTE